MSMKIDRALDTFIEASNNMGMFMVTPTIVWLFFICFTILTFGMVMNIAGEINTEHNVVFIDRLKGVKHFILAFIVLFIISSFLLYYIIESGNRGDVYNSSKDTLDAVIKEDIRKNYVTQDIYLKDLLQPVNLTTPSIVKDEGLYRVSFTYNNEQYSNKLVYFTYNDSIDSGVLIPFKAEEFYPRIVKLVGVPNSGEESLKSIRQIYYFNKSTNTLSEIDYIYNIKIN